MSLTKAMVGIGHDLDLGDLLVPEPEARHDPAAPASRDYSVTGSISDQGLFTCFHWDYVEDENEYFSVLTQFGLGMNDTCEVTVFIRSPRLQFVLYNGLAILPQMGQDAKWDNMFPRAISIYVVNLEEQ